MLAKRIGLEGVVRVGRHVVDLDIERQIHAQARKLHDIVNTLYYDVPMREDDPSGTWCGTPKGRPNSRWAGNDGEINTDEQDTIHTPKFRLAARLKSQQAREKSLAAQAAAAKSGDSPLVASPAVVIAPGQASGACAGQSAEDTIVVGPGGFLTGCAVGAAGTLALLLLLKRIK
jgi:hypothetical protein